MRGGKRLGVVGVKMVKCWRRRRRERNRRSQKTFEEGKRVYVSSSMREIGRK